MRGPALRVRRFGEQRNRGAARDLGKLSEVVPAATFQQGRSEDQGATGLCCDRALLGSTGRVEHFPFADDARGYVASCPNRVRPSVAPNVSEGDANQEAAAPYENRR